MRFLLSAVPVIALGAEFFVFLVMSATMAGDSDRRSWFYFLVIPVYLGTATMLVWALISILAFPRKRS